MPALFLRPLAPCVLSATSTLPVCFSSVTAFQNALSGIAWAAEQLAVVIAIVPANCDRLDVIEITPHAVTSWRLAHAARALQDSGFHWPGKRFAAGYMVRSAAHPIFAPARALLHSVRHASMIADAAARLSRAV